MHHSYDYAAFFCEENIWRLCRRFLDEGRQVRVILMANVKGRFLIWNQRAAGSPSEPLFWDYHVILASRPVDAGPAPWMIWDLDTYCALPAPVADYARASFASDQRIPPHFRPRFRVFEGADFLATFSSDRAHMRRPNGSWRKPPPPWPPILDGTQGLRELIDVTREPAKWRSLEEWLALWS